MGRLISNVELSDTLTLAECSDGFWLWDETQGMNLSMKAKTSTDAFVEALTYYQGRLQEVEGNYRNLYVKVEAFVEQVSEELT